MEGGGALSQFKTLDPWVDFRYVRLHSLKVTYLILV